MQACAQALRHGRFAEGQVERVQVAGAHVHHAADVAVGADHAAHLFLRDQTQLVAVAEALQLLVVLAETLDVRGLVRQVAVAPGQVAVDAVPLDPAADDFHRLQAHQLELAYTLGADHRLELLDTMADAADQLATVTPAGAPADAMGFQQHHRQAALRQFDRRVQPGVAAADDAHVRSHFAAQGREFEAPVGGRGIVGRGVLVGVHRLVNAGVHVRNPDYCVCKI
ncbi:hypothetical protein D3C76_817200 [compost metagenome]